MAKKTKKVEVEPQIETMEEVVTEFFEETFEEPVVEEPKVRERKVPSNEWEIKDRMYFLIGGKRPLSRSIKSANIYYFDKELGYER